MPKQTVNWCFSVKHQNKIPLSQILTPTIKHLLTLSSTNETHQETIVAPRNSKDIAKALPRNPPKPFTIKKDPNRYSKTPPQEINLRYRS